MSAPTRWAGVLAALEAHPDKRLARGVYHAPDGTYCAVGVALPVTRECDGIGILGLLTDNDSVREAVARSGLTASEWDRLQYENDHGADQPSLETPEDRKSVV